MRTSLVSFPILMTIALGSPVQAAADPLSALPAGRSSLPALPAVGKIDQLNAQAAILEAELKIAKLKASIKKANSGERTVRNAMPDHTGFPMEDSLPFRSDAYAPAQQMTSLPNHALPRIESISGAGDHLSAMVSLPNGGQRVVTTGSHLSQDMVVRSITPNGVAVSGKHGMEWLSFVNGPSSQRGHHPAFASTPDAPHPVFPAPVSGFSGPGPLPGAPHFSPAAPPAGGQ